MSGVDRRRRRRRRSFRRANCLFFFSPFFPPSFGLTLSLVSLSNHTLTPPAGLQGQGKVDGKARGAEEDAARGEKEMKIHSTAGRRQLSLLVESLSASPDSQRSRRREVLKKQEAILSL